MAEYGLNMIDLVPTDQLRGPQIFYFVSVERKNRETSRGKGFDMVY